MQPQRDDDHLLLDSQFRPQDAAVTPAYRKRAGRARRLAEQARDEQEIGNLWNIEKGPGDPVD